MLLSSDNLIPREKAKKIAENTMEQLALTIIPDGLF